jgi:hypothetical protein
VWTVLFHPDAEIELDALDACERAAMMNAAEKMAALGPNLPFPHQSHVECAGRIRELRPRAGRSRWRGLYGQVGDAFVVVAISPEANVDPRRFRRAVVAANARLNDIDD